MFREQSYISKQTTFVPIGIKLRPAGTVSKLAVDTYCVLSNSSPYRAYEGLYGQRDLSRCFAGNLHTYNKGSCIRGELMTTYPIPRDRP